LVDPGWRPGAHQSHSLIPLLSWTGERKYNKRFIVEIRTGRDHSLIAVTGKTDSTWEN